MSTTPAAARPPQTEAERTALARRAATASLVGTAIEWYDYFIFGTASVLVFGALFFPSEDPLAGTLAAFAVFGVGFFARPLGGIVFGHIGDRLGRKGALVTTLMMMGIATFLMGLLPTTAQIGVLAPILLVLLRIIQGFGVGGEWGGAALVAVEYAPEGKRGAYGSAPQIGNAIGLVAATGIFALVALLPDEQLFSWGWRIPFLISIVLVAVGLFIRLKLTETPAFVAAQEAAAAAKADGAAPAEEEQIPLRRLLRLERRPLLIAMGLRLGEGIFGYVLLTFVLTYAANYTDLDRSDVLWASCIAAGVAIFTYYFMGRLSDRIGRRPVYLLGAGVAAVMTWPIFLILDTNSFPLVVLMMVVAYSIGIGALYGVQPAMFSELFSTRTRYTGISMAAQLPSMVVGVWPYVATSLLIATDGDPWPVVLITIAMLGVGAWCAVLSKETHRSDIVDPATADRPAGTSS
ncbi:MFS transporter [Pseudonocardia nematodicida]|uniref:MFS transporter n=1 Tax=Pseudonocardia nematodicida TaxID=1206997 RepID=A0ABV1KH90_9PSEU